MAADVASFVQAAGVGMTTGGLVVVFNKGVHALQEALSLQGWVDAATKGAGATDVTASLGAGAPAAAVLVLLPAAGGLANAALRFAAELREGTWEATRPGGRRDGPRLRVAPLRALAAACTLGTGGSLGPEGPSVEIGEATAVAVSGGTMGGRATALFAAGASAGIAAGFNAPVAGVFFAVEVALKQAEERAVLTALDRQRLEGAQGGSAEVAGPSGGSGQQQELPPSTSTAIAMVLISAVTASVVSQQGLGSAPAFVVPEFDLRSSAELPLYLFLGLLGGGVSAMGNRLVDAATAGFARAEAAGIAPRALQPAIGGAFAGAVAIFAPQVLYQGFNNLNEILTLAASSGEAAAGELAGAVATADAASALDAGADAPSSAPMFLLMLELMALKVTTTAVCKGSGLVGGVYAPSIFIGAALGAGYGEIVEALVRAAVDAEMVSPQLVQVAPPQAYALVGMGAVLAGWCRIPLTATLLLFELTRDDRIILPLMVAVGISAWAVEALLPSRKSASAPAGVAMASALGAAASPAGASVDSDPDAESLSMRARALRAQLAASEAQAAGLRDEIRLLEREADAPGE
eukprot:PRCOL_00006058-RA